MAARRARLAAKNICQPLSVFDRRNATIHIGQRVHIRKRIINGVHNEVLAIRINGHRARRQGDGVGKGDLPISLTWVGVTRTMEGEIFSRGARRILVTARLALTISACSQPQYRMVPNRI